MKRYFFISYQTLTNGSVSYIGNTGNITDNGKHFNINKFAEDIKKDTPCDLVIVNNFIELSLSDFQDLYSDVN